MVSTYAPQLTKEEGLIDWTLPASYIHNRVRGLFYPTDPPASTVVEVARFMPGDMALIEVEATIHLP